MLSVITNIYNKKTKWLILMEMFKATGKPKKVFFLNLEMFDVFTMGDRAHVDTIFKLLPHTLIISSCQKKNFFIFPWLWKIPLR